MCRVCARLGPAELAYREEARKIDRLVDCGIVHRRQRKTFEQFLAHPDERVRAYAAGIATRDAELREAFRDARMREEEMDLDWEHAQEPDDA